MQQSTATPAADSAHRLHMGLAEQGKLHALGNRHELALKHYREALRLAVSAKAPEVFFRHYTQCVIESLELTGSFAEVIDFGLKADAHYQTLKNPSDLVKKDWASALERLGANYWKQGARSEAEQWLTRALTIFPDLPLARELLQWLARGFSADKMRIEQLQKKHRNFVVRADQVRADIAIPIEALGAFAGPTG